MWRAGPGKMRRIVPFGPEHPQSGALPAECVV